MMRGMKTSQWREERLRWQGLTAPEADVAGAAGRLLAVQSQDLTAGRWALAVRTKGDVRLRDVDAAFDRGDLVRAWTMRGRSTRSPRAISGGCWRSRPHDSSSRRPPDSGSSASTTP